MPVVDGEFGAAEVGEETNSRALGHVPGSAVGVVKVLGKCLCWMSRSRVSLISRGSFSPGGPRREPVRFCKDSKMSGLNQRRRSRGPGHIGDAQRVLPTVEKIALLGVDICLERRH